MWLYAATTHSSSSLSVYPNVAEVCLFGFINSSLSSGVQWSLERLEAKQRAEHVVEGHPWAGRDPGNELD